MQTKNTTRRAVLAGIAAAPALAAPALALSGPDPIFAAIEAHSSAFEAWSAQVSDQSALEEKLPHDRTKAHRRDDDPSTDDPAWQASFHRYWKEIGVLNAAAVVLGEIRPTTIAGVRALLEYCCVHVEENEGEMVGFPEDCEFYSIAKNAVDALSRFADGEAVS
jgi:hypothetical protein